MAAIIPLFLNRPTLSPTAARRIKALGALAAGTFDLARVQLEVGAVPSAFEDRPRALELLLHARGRGYYLRGELTRNTDLDVLRSYPQFRDLES